MPVTLVLSGPGPRGVTGNGAGPVGHDALAHRSMHMAASEETGQVTGTKDKVYNLVWFTEASLRNALQLEAYIADAERDGDEELAEFFRKAQRVSRQGR